MKGKYRFLVKGSFMMIAVMVIFLVVATNKADAATGSAVITAAEFTTDGGTYTAPGDFYKHFSGAYLEGGANGPCFVARVPIPGSATKINKLIVYLTDTNVTKDPYFQLTALNIATTDYEDYFAADVLTGTDTIQAIELTLDKHALVKGRVYQLGTCLYDGQQLYGAKVIYTVP
jgi:hypothetical protein